LVVAWVDVTAGKWVVAWVDVTAGKWVVAWVVATAESMVVGWVVELADHWDLEVFLLVALMVASMAPSKADLWGGEP